MEFWLLNRRKWTFLLRKTTLRWVAAASEVMWLKAPSITASVDKAHARVVTGSLKEK
jgi:hypothetical protein